MREYIHIIICVYLVGVSLLAIGLMVYDKRAVRKKVWRVKERTLLFVSFLGGAVAMFAIMAVSSIRSNTPSLWSVQEQLERLKTDYIDYYLIQNISDASA